MEILSDILKSLRVRGSVYFCDHLEPPWTQEFCDHSAASFHLVRQGSCLAIIDGKVEKLDAGDLLFLSPGVVHVLTSESPQGYEPPPSENTLLLCGYCSFEKETLTPLKNIFPQSIIVRETELRLHTWLKSTFDQLSAEYMSQKPGTEIIVNKLTEVVMVELIRINFGRRKNDSFLMALKDKRITKALQLMHESPSESWTIELLASHIGMSRAAFARQFRTLVGETMFAYLSQLRIQRAKEMLLSSGLAVGDIALDIGYESERSFTKTFSKYVGMTPRQYRKQ